MKSRAQGSNSFLLLPLQHEFFNTSIASQMSAVCSEEDEQALHLGHFNDVH